MDIKEVYSSIDKLTAQLTEMTAKLEEAVRLAVNEAATENPTSIKRLGEHCFIVKASDIMGKPWNPSFYDWNKSAEIVIEHLKSKPCIEWKKILQSKLEKSKDGVVTFDKTTGSGYYRTITTTPVDKRFIEKIISKL